MAGVLIAIEGLDGAGKRTQVALLAEALGREGIPHRLHSFPRYDSFFGRIVRVYLDGSFGDPAALDPHLPAVLFAGDRYQAKAELLGESAAGLVVVADRYVGSNLAYHGARLPVAERPAFREWLQRLEYEHFGIPQPSLTLYLDTPVEIAVDLMERRHREQGRSLDEYERDRAYLARVHEEYQELSRVLPGWVRVDAVDAAGNLRAAEQVHAEFRHAVLTAIGRPSRTT